MLSLNQGVRLEANILCDERLSPRIYGLRYQRQSDSGQMSVDVMLRFAQPRPR